MQTGALSLLLLLWSVGESSPMGGPGRAGHVILCHRDGKRIRERVPGVERKDGMRPNVGFLGTTFASATLLSCQAP